MFACALPATGTDTTSGPHLPRRSAGNFTAYPPPREIKIPRRTETKEQPRQSREVARARKKWASKRPPTNTPVRGYLTDDLEVINLAAIQSYMNKAGDKLPADKLSELLNAETWLTAEDCIEYGLADEYADTDADLDEAIRQYRAAMEAAPQMQLEKAMPSFMPAAKAPKTAPLPPAEPSPASPAEAAEGKKTSAIFMLLESMTKE